MSWRLEVRHVTRYSYDRPVLASYNEARVTPAVTRGQAVIEAHLEVQPATTLFRYTDYWGTTVHAFDVHDPHESLTVTARAVVETGVGAGDPTPVPAARWADLAAPADHFYELLARSRYVEPKELSEVALAIRSECATPAHALPAVMDWVNGQLAYQPGSTHSQTSAVEAWKAGLGVCQDFSHLTIGVMRAMGVPARYVSGYFFPGASPEVGAKVTGESHAWVEAWLGQWVALDPTNRVPVGERHVVVARGRDYSDVTPLRGIYSGPPGSSTKVTVELRRLA